MGVNIEEYMNGPATPGGSGLWHSNFVNCRRTCAFRPFSNSWATI